jgi:hypothetical protein
MIIVIAIFDFSMVILDAIKDPISMAFLSLMLL